MLVSNFFTTSTGTLNPLLSAPHDLKVLEIDPIFHTDLELLPPKLLHRLLNTGVGIEIEVENSQALSKIPYWNVIEDHSLRNSGFEYRTNYGLRIGYVNKALNTLNKNFASNNPHKIYTERCSVHVHLDVRRFDHEQLQNLLILYSLVEEILFHLAGELRSENIFCVPIRESTDFSINIPDVWEYIEHCSKYTALNFKCIQTFGTVEFRHMEGTDDPVRLTKWIFLLGLLHQAARSWDTKDLKEQILRMKNTSQYEIILRQIFKSFLDYLPWRGLDLDSAVSDAKLFFWDK